jgi:hypothetical protein
MALTARRLAGCSALAILVVLVAAQFLPVNRTNPPSDPRMHFNQVLNPPPNVKASLERACRDCHTHDTTWPWYSKVAPASLLLASDVKEGREHLNLSEWGRLDAKRAVRKLDEMCEEMTSDAMPPGIYTLMHGEAKLTRAEVQAFCGWAKSVK